MLKNIIKEFSKLSNENSSFILKIFISKIKCIPIKKISFETIDLSSYEIDTLTQYIKEYLSSGILNDSE